MRILLAFLLPLIIDGCATTNKEPATSVSTRESSASTADVVVWDTSGLDKIVNVFSEELKSKPNEGGLYYNRAVAYFYKREFDKCWDDVHSAQKLGYRFDSAFLEKLSAASGREK